MANVFRVYTLITALLLTACTPVFDPRDSSVASDAEVKRGVALTYGAQNGLAAEAEKINKILENHKNDLDKVYNFNVIMMKNNMLPPVVQESKHTMHIEGTDTMRLSDVEIQIVRPAQLVTTAPTWRDYLVLSYAAPEKPDASVLPQTMEERKAWKESYAKGWAQGVQQASDIFAQALGTLNRDFKGMVLYHTLVTQNMMRSAYTAKAHLGVTGTDDVMRINDQVLRITETAKLNSTHPEEWQAILDTSDA